MRENSSDANGAHTFVKLVRGSPRFASLLLDRERVETISDIVKWEEIDRHYDVQSQSVAPHRQR